MEGQKSAAPLLSFQRNNDIRKVEDRNRLDLEHRVTQSRGTVHTNRSPVHFEGPFRDGFRAGSDETFFHAIGVAPCFDDRAAADHELLVREAGCIIKGTGLVAEIEFGPGTDQPLLFLAKAGRPARQPLAGGFVVFQVFGRNVNVLIGDLHMPPRAIARLGEPLLKIRYEQNRPVAVRNFRSHSILLGPRSVDAGSASKNSGDNHPPCTHSWVSTNTRVALPLRLV